MSDQTQPETQAPKTHWLDHPETPRRLWTGLGVALVLIIIAEFFVTHHHEGLMFSFGFSAWFGFLVAAVSIVFSKGWKKVLKRKDTYYDQ